MRIELRPVRVLLTALFLCTATLTTLPRIADAQEARPKRKGKKARVTIESTPSGAEVFLDDEKYGPVGTTPWKGRLARGKWTVILKKDGYEIAREELRVRRKGADTKIRMTQLASSDEEAENEEEDFEDVAGSSEEEQNTQDEEEVDEDDDKEEAASKGDKEVDEDDADPDEDMPTGGNYGGSTGFDTGFYIESADKRFRLNLGMEARVQLSVFQRKTPDADRIDAPSRATIRPRSMQFILYGTAFEKFGFEFAQGLTPDPTRPLDSGTVYFASMSYRQSPAFTLSAGMVFVPFGIEASSYFFGFRTIERSVTFQWSTPFRDAGVMASGMLFNNRLYYNIGVIGGSGVAFIEPQDEPDGVARIQFEPIRNNLKVGVSAQYGLQPFNVAGGLIFSNTFAQLDPIFSSATNGLRQRYAADLLLTVGPFSLQAEGLYENTKRENILNEAGQVIEDGPLDASDLVKYGGYAEMGLFLAGDRRQGGFELVGKYERLAVQTDGAPNELQPIELNLYTAGFNWYIHSSVRFQVNGMLYDLKRLRTPEFATDAPVTYLDNAKRYVGLAQLQFWFF